MSGRWRQELDRAAAAAHAAGKRLRARTPADLAVLDDGGHDIKLAADREAEAIIVGQLGESGFPILAEERGEIGNVATSAPVWVVDPLDGTMNFSRGIPLCCVSIALMEGEQPVLGVVYDFNRDETFAGLAAGGAWLNGAPICVSQVAAPDRAVLATGFPSFRDYSPEALKQTIESFRSFKKVRMLGSAALMLAYLASGRVDAYQEEDIMLWDVAAGLALVKGAGGSVSVAPSARRRWGRRVQCASRASIWTPW